MTWQYTFVQDAGENDYDTDILLICSDWLTDQGDPSGELLRLVAAEGGINGHSKVQPARLQRLRDEALEAVNKTAWTDKLLWRPAAASFSRRPDSSRPGREWIVLRLDRHTIHWFSTEVEGGDEVIRTRHGQELLRHPLSAVTLESLRRGEDIFRHYPLQFSGRYFPQLVAWEDNLKAIRAERRRSLAEQGQMVAEQGRLVERALAPAAISAADLPIELQACLAWLLMEYACDRRRRARAGQIVPGAHIFLFWTDTASWRHEEAVESWKVRKAAGVLRHRLRLLASRRWPIQGGQPSLAGLLVRVSDHGRITARKLAWLYPDNVFRETANLYGAGATLSGDHFRQVLADLDVVLAGLGGDHSRFQDAFIVDTQDKLRGLFTSEAGRIREE